MVLWESYDWDVDLVAAGVGKVNGVESVEMRPGNGPKYR